MATIENQHWDSIDHDLTGWASYLVLGAYENDPFSARQRQIMSDYLMSSVDTYVQSLEALQAAPDVPEIDLMLTIEALDEDEAIEGSLAVGLGALTSIGVRLETVEFLALYLVNKKQLVADRQAAPSTLIANSWCDISKAAQEVFIEELGLMADCQRLAGLPTV